MDECYIGSELVYFYMQLYAAITETVFWVAQRPLTHQGSCPGGGGVQSVMLVILLLSSWIYDNLRGRSFHVNGGSTTQDWRFIHDTYNWRRVGVFACSKNVYTHTHEHITHAKLNKQPKCRSPSRRPLILHVTVTNDVKIENTYRCYCTILMIIRSC
jgi:hypothetical protein